MQDGNRERVSPCCGSLLISFIRLNLGAFYFPLTLIVFQSRKKWPGKLSLASFKHLCSQVISDAAEPSSMSRGIFLTNDSPLLSPQLDI